MIENDAQLKITIKKIEDLRSSLEYDLTEISADVREKVIHERRELIAKLEQDVMAYEVSKSEEVKIG